MSKVIKSELTSSSLDNLNNLLSKEISDTENLINTINKLIDGEKDTLSGEGYNTVRTKLSTYISVLQERKIIASSLQESIKTSLGKMETFIDIYPELDTSKLSEIEKRLKELENTISSITHDFNNGKYDDENGNPKVTLSSLTSTYQTELEEKKKLKDKLTELPSIDNQAFQAVEELEADIKKYATKASEISESSINL